MSRSCWGSMVLPMLGMKSHVVPKVLSPLDLPLPTSYPKVKIFSALQRRKCQCSSCQPGVRQLPPPTAIFPQPALEVRYPHCPTSTSRIPGTLSKPRVVGKVTRGHCWLHQTLVDCFFSSQIQKSWKETGICIHHLRA